MGCRSSQYITSISQYIPGISGKDVKISPWWNLAGFPAGQIKNIFKWPNRHGVSRALAVYCFFSLISLAESANFTLSFTDIWHIRKPKSSSHRIGWWDNLQETYDRAVPIPSPLRSCCDCCHSAFSCVGREFPSPKMHWSQWQQWVMLSQGFPATFLVIWCVQATLALGLSLLGCPSDAAQRSASQKRMERLFLNLRERGPGGPRRRPEEPSDEELYSWLSMLMDENSGTSGLIHEPTEATGYATSHHPLPCAPGIFTTELLQFLWMWKTQSATEEVKQLVTQSDRHWAFLRISPWMNVLKLGDLDVCWFAEAKKNRDWVLFYVILPWITTTTWDFLFF